MDDGDKRGSGASGGKLREMEDIPHLLWGYDGLWSDSLSYSSNRKIATKK